MKQLLQLKQIVTLRSSKKNNMQRFSRYVFHLMIVIVNQMVSLMLTMMIITLSQFWLKKIRKKPDPGFRRKPCTFLRIPKGFPRVS